ncbi:alpha/beta hydrolase [Candidatus Kaiserbacteria bacterium]|nr:alpha/beta hydrolase [Candidatus Kaiserbacteria bacterium]
MGDKQQVFYIHGGKAYSNYSDYIEYLKTAEIRNLPSSIQMKKWSNSLPESLGEDYEVFMPSMPNSNNAKYKEWKIWFERHFEYLKDGVVLLGWSQGGYFLTKYLIENELPFIAKALILVAAPFEADDFGGEDGGDFAFATEKVGDIAEKVEKIYILHSKDDFVVPYDHALRFKAGLPPATLLSFEDKNHFLIEEFPEIISLIKSM